jgi:hypothetical protein
MKDLNETAFVNLFKQACEKGLGQSLQAPLSEPDSKILSNKIFEQTGLVIGAKSIKNYSLYILQPTEVKKENPTIATLDTLARYVLDAPYTEETRRKNHEDHHPYWFQYRSQFTKAPAAEKVLWKPDKKTSIALIGLILLLPAFLLLRSCFQEIPQEDLIETFTDVSADSLKSKGWSVNNPDTDWWNKRNRIAGHLSLYTQRGDNWSNDPESDKIKNLVYRKIESDCFSAEVRLSDFFPKQNWQQAGILLSEDEGFTGKVLRLSLAYNNFFGGYEKPPEIIIQGLSSSESGTKSKPEEFVHFPLFNLRQEEVELVTANLAHFAFKIEKHSNRFRFLYATGSEEVFAFKEVVSSDFSIRPRYIGLYAIQGLADSAVVIPADFDYFRLVDLPCN